MNKKIESIIKKNKKFNYFQRCFRRRNDPEFVNSVLEIGKNPLLIKINRLGDKNSGRLIYVAQTMGCDGFFAELRFILSEIYFADTFGMTPVVLMPQNSCYCEAYPVNGTTNPFEYYFKPVSDIPVESALESCAVVEHNYYQRNYIKDVCGMSSGYLPTDDYMNTMASVVNKYLHLNEICKEKIQADILAILNKKSTLAVHVRGADFKRHYSNHPNIVTIDEYVTAVNEALCQNDFEQIFLATDDLHALNRFKEIYGEKLVYYPDVIRTADDETVMKSHSSRENHHYNLGLEVIRDMYTLSACDGIIAGLSNVSIFARIVKLSKNSDYLYKNYLNKGIKEK